jgi:hypothetical protein
MQDTIKPKVFAGNDTIIQQKDTALTIKAQAESLAVAAPARRIFIPEITNTDTISVCTRGVIADVTFHDSLSFIRNPRPENTGMFPYTFILRSREAKLDYSRSLKEGRQLPQPEYQSDWIVPVLLFAALLLAVVRTFPGGFFRSIIRFLLMRGIGESASRDTGILFQWRSTLFNLASFISVSLFGYLALKHFGIEIPGINGFSAWFLCLLTVISGISLRHIICNITGNISGQEEIFREYLVSVYQSYRSAGIFYLLLLLLILYTKYTSPQLFFFTGFFAAGLLYLLRISRLFMIFMIRHVSIFYWILYLCALEILPVVIIVKYITGLV